MSGTTTTVYSGRVTNWPLFWLMNVLALALVAPVVTDAQARVPLAIAAVVVLLANLTMTSVRTTAGPQGVVVRFGVLARNATHHPVGAAARTAAMRRQAGDDQRREPTRRGRRHQRDLGPDAMTPELAARAAALSATGRAVVGITGAPGAGKSTLAGELAAAVPGTVVVPMDGFHRPTSWLEPRGLVERRGAPETFDAEGYVVLLEALRRGGQVRAPDFDRPHEEPVPAALMVPADASLVLTEGNYLLLDTEPWRHVHELLDETWFVEVPEQVRVERLVARFVSFGWDATVAQARVLTGSDAANARLVAASRDRADLVVRPSTGAIDRAR